MDSFQYFVFFLLRVLPIIVLFALPNPFLNRRCSCCFFIFVRWSCFIFLLFTLNFNFRKRMQERKWTSQREGKMKIFPNWSNGKKGGSTNKYNGNAYIIIIRRAEGTINTTQLTYTPYRILKKWGASRSSRKEGIRKAEQKR